MAIKFNPFTGNFDLTGSGGGSSYIDGEEAVYGDLSLDAGVAPLNSAWLVRNSSGIWPFNKPGGIYIRTATAGVSRDADYTYAGTMPDVFSDAVLTIYDEASTTRTGQFNLGGVTAGQNRVLTWPDASGVIDIAATRTAATYSTDQALPATRNTQLVVGNSSAGSINLDLPTTNTNDGDIYTLIGGSVVGPIVIRRRVLSSPEIWTEQARITTEGQNHTFRALGNGNNNWELVSANWARPSAIGSVTANSGSFTTLSANNGTLTASAPVLDLAQTWNNAAVTFTGLRFNATDTASAAESSIAEFQVGGTRMASFRKDGVLVFRTGNPAITILRAGNFSLSSVGNGSTLQSDGIIAASNFFGNGGVFQLRASNGQSAVVLARDDANIFAQRNGAGQPQAFRLYNTFTSATNFERLNVRWASNELIIDAEAGGSGTLRGIMLGSASTSLLGFFGATPAVQGAAVADATDAATTQARLNDLLARVRTLGLIAT